jgi:multisubunit Na+/H+ antiporter MnhB subunit
MPTPDIAVPSTLLQQLPLPIPFPVSPDVAIRTWEPLALRAVVIVVYLVFIFEFYRFVARRDIFKLRFRRYARGVVGRSVESVGNVVRVLLYVVEYLVVYPLLTIVWYVFYLLLVVLLAPGVDIQVLLVTAMAIVTAIRVTAYYSQNLSQDLAKMLPLGILGALILEDAPALPAEIPVDVVVAVAEQWETILLYLLFLVLLEFVLRIGQVLATRQLQTGRTEENVGGDG